MTRPRSTASHRSIAFPHPHANRLQPPIRPAMQSLTIKSIKSLAPLLDRVLIQRAKVVEKTASGLFLPSAANNSPPPEGLVLAVGPGAPGKDGQIVPVSVKAGDRVVLPAFGGVGVKVGDEEYQLFRDSEILAKLNE
ncbi:BQ5605_C019g08852 [Microbotryum silenes-dioicae]|uniref:BQ5605_C019g08852 protein n=1 Tax=Microbotryum silenes-dioicae TaxID=796604 RepID=A0A2X0NZD4_9BASI|nr:BQ5605_C019g08852 [Microbotryum silenes-dioicae]